ncbi:hypothetical protein V6N11_061794 [Hibiscus sabdariffa]|uniref:Uncharacterized protein n=1 Tax=Hibiscus sabdariffa TaxID=183260 RepID=A0ABR1ZUN7_9ROSI
MVGYTRVRGRGNQGQHMVLTENRSKIEKLLQAVQALQGQGHVETQMETPEGAHNQFDMPKGSPTDESDMGEIEHSFHDAGPAKLAKSVYPVQGESLVVHRTMTTKTLEQGKDWRLDLDI